MSLVLICQIRGPNQRAYFEGAFLLRYIVLTAYTYQESVDQHKRAFDVERHQLVNEFERPDCLSTQLGFEARLSIALLASSHPAAMNDLNQPKTGKQSVTQLSQALLKA